MLYDAFDDTTLIRGELYEWDWPLIGAGVMARRRALLPLGRAITRDDVPQMDKSVTSIGFQVLQDTNWIIAPDWIIANGCRFWRKVDV